MNNFTVIPVYEEERWDEVVKSFANYDVYYLNAYVKAFQLIGDGIPYLFYYKGEKTRAINVFMKRDISDDIRFKEKIEKGKYFDIATPYGYGGFIIEGNDYNTVGDLFEEYCKENSIISEFVRFHPMLNNHILMESFYMEQYCGETVFIDLQNTKMIWNNMTSKNRNMVRKAQKFGLKTYWGRDEKIKDLFIEMYNETMKRDNALPYYFFNEGFYQSVLHDLKNNAIWFYVQKESEIIASAIFLFANNYIHYHLSASKEEYRSLAPTNLLLYEAAVWGSINGFKKLHMGGGVGGKEDNLYKFKKAFNKKENSQFYIGTKIYDNKKYNELVAIRKEAYNPTMQNGYFPIYRS